MANSISGVTAGMSGVTVSYTGTATGSVVSTTGGAFTISGLGAGTYTLTPTLAGYTFSQSVNVTIAASNVTNIQFTAYSITDQWAQCTVTALAPNIATLHLTAVAGSSSTWTYTYTVTQGSVAVPVAGGFLCVVISGMQNTGNNGTFVATTFGAGIFTITNASGVAEAGSSGTGICPSDSGVGVCVRASQSTNTAAQNLYFFHAGTNSYSADGRTGFHELWKTVAGSGSFLGGVAGAPAVPPSVNDILAISAEGPTISGWVNGAVYVNPSNSTVFSMSDLSLTSGSQGITAWSISGQQEYDFPIWNATPFLASNTPGNNGTQANNYLAGTIAQSQLASDLFAYGTNADLHAANASWVYEGASLFQVVSNVVYASSGQVPTFAYRADVTPTADQYSQVTVVAGGAFNSQNCGPAVRVSASAQTAYMARFGNNSFRLTKYVAGTPTDLGSILSSPPVTGDIIRITAVGTSITIYRNGLAMVSVVDTSIATGNVGIFGAGNQTLNGFTSWAGGNYTWAQTQSDTFNRANGALGNHWAGPYSNASENAGCPLTQASINIVSDAYSSINSNGGDTYAVFQISPPSPFIGWSPLDCRIAVPNFGPAANTGIADAQGDEIFSAQDPPFSGNSQTSDNVAIPPADSRVVKPSDSRVNVPTNSRVAPPFGNFPEP